MGDRFYTQQKNHKRRLKKDVIADLNKLLNAEIKGLDRLTIATLEALILIIEKLNRRASKIAMKYTALKFEKAMKNLAK